MNHLLQTLDRPIAFHSIFVDLTGSITAALMLSQAFYWSRRTKDPDGWFYKNQEEWQTETRLSRAEQETARKQLRATGFWFEERRGIPARLYYRIDLGKLESRLRESSILECENPADSSAGMSHSGMPESRNLSNNSETTTETTHTRERSSLPPVSNVSRFVANRGRPQPNGHKKKPVAPERLPMAKGLRPVDEAVAQVTHRYRDIDVEETILKWRAKRLSDGALSADWNADFIYFASNCHQNVTERQNRYAERENAYR